MPRPHAGLIAAIVAGLSALLVAPAGSAPSGETGAAFYRGKTVTVCGDAGPRLIMKPCPPPAEGTRVRRLRYAEGMGGRLRVD